MKIKVNGEPVEFQTDPTIDVVLQHFGIQRLDGIAVALNERVVPRSDFVRTTVSSGDEVEIIRATQGG